MIKLKLNILCILILLNIQSCSISKQSTIIDMKDVAFQGHRGCRGLMPENTIPAFEKALDYVEILEMDVVVSKDNKIIVSHEAWMSSTICSHPNGEPVLKKEEKDLAIYKMTYEEVKKYDCGLRDHPKFSEQKKLKVHKPSFVDVVKHIENYCLVNNKKAPWYDIEIKSEEAHYGELIPAPQFFVELMLKELNDLGVKERCNLQSFDVNILEEIHKQDPEIIIAYLVENIEGVKDNLEKLSFKPQIYSPYYKLVKKKTIKLCHSKKIKVIPWTVNKPEQMKKLAILGVDGIITDYPNLIGSF